MKAIYVIKNKDDLADLIQQIEQNRFKPVVDSVLIFDDADYDPITFGIEDVFKFNQLLGLFKYVCHHDQVVFSHFDKPKAGDECPEYNVVKYVYDLVHNGYIPSPAVLKLVKFVSENAGIPITQLIKKSTSNKEDQERILLAALRYDAEYTIKVVTDEIKKQFEEITDILKKVTEMMGGKNE